MKKQTSFYQTAFFFSVLFFLVVTLSSPSQAAEKNLSALTASEIAGMIKAGQITSVELVTVLLERIRQYNPAINAFITVDEKAVLEQARRADDMVKSGAKLGKLHGVPFAIKDNIDVHGLPNTNGTPALAKHYPKKDAEIVTLLKKEGAIIIGKSNLHELVFGITSNNKHFGAVKNPYNTACFAGGSSGGNGAAISARLVPVGIGTDTGGSIRIPAALTGIYGYRPSVGRFSCQGVVPMSKTKDTTGPMARSVADLILVDSAVSGYDAGRIHKAQLNGLRFGVPEYSFYENMDPETEKLVRAALDKLKAAGATLVKADIPNIDKLDRDVDFPMSLYECKRDFPEYFAEYGIKIEDVVAQIASPDVKYPFDHFVLGKEAVTEQAYNEVMTVHRVTMIKAYTDYFKNNKVDAIIFPTTVLPARPIEGSDESVALNGQKTPTFPAYIKNTSPGSNAGMAGVTMPVGLTAQGLPVGMEIDILPGQDEKLLSIALALEEIFGNVPPPKGF